MRKLLLIAGLAVAVAAPAVTTFVPAQAAAASCETNKTNNRIAGTVGGGLLGALAGSAVDKSRSNTAGILIGGAAGAVVGNQLTKGHHPCPTGYTARNYRSSSSSRARTVASNCSWQDQRYRDAYGNISHRQVQVCR